MDKDDITIKAADVPKSLSDVMKGMMPKMESVPLATRFARESRLDSLNGLAAIRARTDANLASGFHERLLEVVARFEASLDEQHEVGVRLVSFGQSVTFHLENIGYWNPALMSFSGVTEDGDPVQLVQHVSQISILLMKLKRLDPTVPKEPIGFYVPDETSPSET